MKSPKRKGRPNGRPSVSINPFLSFRGAQHPQGVRRIRKAAELPTAAQRRGNPNPRPAASLVKGRWHGEAVTEGFRLSESYPKTGIPQSASLTASPIPFVPSGHFPLTRGIGLAMTGFFDSLILIVRFPAALPLASFCGGRPPAASDRPRRPGGRPEASRPRPERLRPR